MPAADLTCSSESRFLQKTRKNLFLTRKISRMANLKHLLWSYFKTPIRDNFSLNFICFSGNFFRKRLFSSTLCHLTEHQHHSSRTIWKRKVTSKMDGWIPISSTSRSKYLCMTAHSSNLMGKKDYFPLMLFQYSSYHLIVPKNLS